jgi:murein DD-endopeptidase / murein LD-carboxypeptidase
VKKTNIYILNKIRKTTALFLKPKHASALKPIQPGIYLLLTLLLMFSFACQTTKKVSTTVTNTTTSEFYTKYSKKLGVELTGTEDKKFIEVIAGWMGTPYVYGGESKKGTDCSGMVQTIYKDLYNISLYRSAAEQVKDCDRISKKNLRCRDLVFFKIKSRKVSHVGIYIAKGKFIHASSKGVIVSDLKEAYYARYFCSGGRVKKLK